MNTILDIIKNTLEIITPFILSNKQKKERREEEYRRIKYIQFENRPNLEIQTDKEKRESIPRINLFIGRYEAQFSKKTNKVYFHYSKEILNEKKYKHKIFCIQNKGNDDIYQLDICASVLKYTMLTDIENLKFIVNNQIGNFSYRYDKNIKKNDCIIVDIAYLEASLPYNVTQCELVLLFKDSNSNHYQQPFFIHDSYLEDSSCISKEEYRTSISNDIVIECIKNPLLW